MQTLNHLLERNQKWAARIKAEQPDFFQKLAQQQRPEYLWIGCSDSRVPANQIIDRMPGEVFVHRNIANLVIHTDFNCLSVIQYAVEVLQVKYIIVCGHYGCGGIKAAMETQSHGLIDNWLQHIQEVKRYYRSVLDSIEDKSLYFDRLCEFNVIEQVNNIARTTIVQNAWQRGQSLSLHGWIYRLQDGLIRDLKVKI